VAGVVFGISQAFFSDREVSTGNLFQAGAIDLKIDHTMASYNGKDCLRDCVEQENLVHNISFEAPVVATPQLWDIYPSPVGGWNVDWRADVPATYNSVNRPTPANLEYHRGVLGLAYEGQQYVELDSDWDGPSGGLNNEPASVTIYQNIPTTAGNNYKLRFAFAPRPNTPANNNRLEVKWGGNVVWDSGTVAGGGGSIAWQYMQLDVAATGSSTELRFTDLGTADSYGTFLDAITVKEVVCNTTLNEEQCKLWELKDLGQGDFIWNFHDVKPGDYGRNVLSYHVYDNNAWMCTFLEKQDLENVMLEPESPPDVAGPDGELSKYLEVFIWGDDNDGVYEPPTESMIAQGTLDSLNYFPIAEPPGTPVVASTTKYLGLQWCFGDLSEVSGVFTCDGTGNQNDAQSDILNETIKFYIEQARNNPDFRCTGNPTNGEVLGVSVIAPSDPWINEIHYDNAGTDTEEGVEIAGPAGTNLSGWYLKLYNGSGGAYYSVIALSGVIPDQQAGFGTLWFSTPGLQNGAPDGLALVAPGSQVIQFLSYEGSFIASNGPASGMISTNLGVDEEPAVAVGQSMQLQGAGDKYPDFVWVSPVGQTKGLVNTGQTFN